MKLSKKLQNFLVYVSVTLALVLFSFFLRNFLQMYCNKQNFFFFDIDFVKNTGAAFSLFQTHTDILIVLSVFILTMVVFYVIKHLNSLKLSSLILLSLFSAGIIGNLAERIADGFVTDYIRLTFVDFPIFNISDVFINTAAFLIICNIIFNNDKQQN